MTTIPTEFRTARNYASYHPGWLGGDGTLHYVQSHIDFKPRGWKAANERHLKAQRQARREAGLPLLAKARWGGREWTPRNIDTYRWLSDHGYMRLEVCAAKQVTVEAYPGWGGGFETVLTEAAADALCTLVHTIQAPVLHLRNGWAKPPHSVLSEKIHDAHDILRVVQ